MPNSFDKYIAKTVYADHLNIDSERILRALKKASVAVHGSGDLDHYTDLIMSIHAIEFFKDKMEEINGKAIETRKQEG